VPANAEPVHLLVDSTGLKLSGAGEWLVEKHGTSRRRSWRKLHIGVDADTGQIVAAALTTNDVDDGSQVGPLLDQIDRPVAAFTGVGAYDQEGSMARSLPLIPMRWSSCHRVQLQYRARRPRPHPHSATDIYN
jgi:hypothetical protein